jgi:ketosteroid isomerase-like protein
MEESKRVVLILFEALNARDLDLWSRQLADDFTAEYPGMPILDKTQSRMFNLVIHHVLAEGDRVLADWTATGSQTERLAIVSGETLPPSGNTVTIKGVLLA